MNPQIIICIQGCLEVCRNLKAYFSFHYPDGNFVFVNEAGLGYDYLVKGTPSHEMLGVTLPKLFGIKRYIPRFF